MAAPHHTLRCVTPVRLLGTVATNVRAAVSCQTRRHDGAVFINLPRLGENASRGLDALIIPRRRLELRNVVNDRLGEDRPPTYLHTRHQRSVALRGFRRSREFRRAVNHTQGEGLGPLMV